MRLSAKLLKQINAILPVQSCAQKYSAFPVGQINSTSCPVLSDRGALRNVINAGGMRWTRVAPLTNGADADGEVVWS